MRILVVEDERRIGRAIKEGLEQDRYAVDLEFNGEDGYNTVTAAPDDYDLIITDVMMPGLDGFSLVKKLRGDGVKTPILVLTAKGQEKDIVEGLDTGADDYLAKPFSFSVLSARVRALLRRPREAQSEVLKYADVELDPAGMTATRAGKNLHLSAKEFAILEYFLRNPDRILSKNNLLTHVWDFDADVLPNNVESFMKLLRAKLDKPFEKSLLHTIRGFGYKLSEEA